MARNTKHDCPHCGCDTRPMKQRILSSKMNAFFCQQECYHHYRKRREAIDPMMESLIEKAKEGIKVIGIFHQTEDDVDDFEVIEFFSVKGEVEKGAILGRGETLHAARKFVPKGMIQIANRPKDDPKLVEAWIYTLEGTA